MNNLTPNWAPHWQGHKKTLSIHAAYCCIDHIGQTKEISMEASKVLLKFFPYFFLCIGAFTMMTFMSWAANYFVYSPCSVITLSPIPYKSSWVLVKLCTQTPTNHICNCSNHLTLKHGSPFTLLFSTAIPASVRMHLCINDSLPTMTALTIRWQLPIFYSTYFFPGI